MMQRARTNSRRLAVVLFGGVPALLASTASAGLASRIAHPQPLKAIYGPLTLPDGASAFPTYHRLGVQVLELQLSWEAVASSRPANAADPGDPAYRWPADLERAIHQAARYHIAIALLVEDFPPWSNGGRGPAWAPAMAADYAAFVQAASRRYPGVRSWTPFHMSPPWAGMSCWTNPAPASGTSARG